MTDHQSHTTDSDDRAFRWHPDYRGRTAESVERELADQIANDQRAYELALSGAEQSEHQALASVMDLEKRWSVYSFDWSETPSDGLARRIVDFELERDRRQEMISYEQYRDEAGAQSAGTRGGWRESLTDEQRLRVARIGAGVVMVVIVLMIIMVVSIVL
jgi:hypothetical protein